MLLLWDMLPKKRMSDDVGSLPYFRFCHNDGLHLRCFPAFMSILIAVHILRSAQLFPSRRWPFPPCSWRLYLIALRRSWSGAVPNSCGSSWILKCQSWAPGRRGGGVWVGSQWECAVTRANPSDVAWIALLGARLLHPRRCACVARLRPACGLCSASQRAVFPPDSPIRSVSQRMHTVCAPSVVSDSAWLGSEGRLGPLTWPGGGAPELQRRSREGPQGEVTLGDSLSSSPLLLLKDSRNRRPGSLRLPHQFILRVPPGWVSLWLQGSEGKRPVLCVSRQNA